METKNITLQKYPAYKDSGVEWLGEIPEHWNVKRFKFLFKEINERSLDGNEELLSVSQYTGVTKKSDKVEDGDLITTASTLEGYKKVSKFDLVSNIMLAWNGSLGFSSFDGITSPAYSVYRLIEFNHVGYFHYMVRSNLYKSEFKRNSSGVIESRLRLYTDSFYSIWSIQPPLSEQTAIAAFLDDKTAKIDRAIAQKEKMITLLKERKQIIIQNAVTKGLEPNAKMKDSGVEWIGEIPEGWEVKRLKYIIDKIKTGTTPPTSIQAYFDGGVNWYNPKDLNHEILIASEKTVSQKAIDRNEIKLFKKDSILIVGIGATTGKTAYMSDYGTFNQQITGFHSEKHLNYYYFFLLKSLSTVMLNVASYTTLPILNNEFFKSFWLIVPPLDEQTAIVSHIETQSAKIDKAINLQEQQIEKLKELKSTLIDSAVTGKIKVS